MPLNAHRARWRINTVRFAAALVVLVVASAVVVEARTGVAKTNSLGSSKNVARWNLENAYFSCLTRQVEGLVPSGSPVWVSVNTPGGPAIANTLEKVVAPYAPLAYLPIGVVKLILVEAPNGKGCLGVRVKAVAPDGAVRFGSGSLVSSLRLPTADR